MIRYIRHIALFVPDLREAESYYQALFQMELIGREAQLDDGEWYSLPLDKGWEDAEAAGIELDMLALKKEDIILALFAGPQSEGQLFAIGLALPGKDVAAVRKNLPADAVVSLDRPGQFNFRDRYGITWQLVPPGDKFLTSALTDSRWLEI